ncbi:ATP-binding cassette domain-containing protein [Brooklawnia sp.]|uniref:ABC transporter ATP-binding protein n=1 Tax=Brooklawnia sp. TaxID=2699740 RepID=UPI00311E7433
MIDSELESSNSGHAPVMTLAERRARAQPARLPSTAAPATDLGSVIRIEDLSIQTEAGSPILTDVSLEVAAGQTHALVGESGSGKTTLALALFGRLRPGLVHSGGRVQVCGSEPLALTGPRLRTLRRQRLAWLGQDPALALTPHLTIGELLREVSATGGRDEDLLGVAAHLGLGSITDLLQRRPHQLSGGQRRRAAFVRALASSPDVLVLDEPTNGLDQQAIGQVVEIVRDLRSSHHLTVLIITHDLTVARQMADRISFMADGRIAETITTGELDGSAQPLVREALRAAQLPAYHPPRLESSEQEQPDAGSVPAPGDGPGSDAALAACGLQVLTPAGDPVLADVDLVLQPGETVALLGPSGAGKTTLVRTLIGSHPPQSGELRLGGRHAPWRLDDRSPAQRRAVQLIGQDPAGSLNPAVSIGRQLDRAVARARPELGRRACRDEVLALLDAVQLPPSHLRHLPKMLSGGQAQRVAIARALAHQPSVLLCDEATSSLDPAIQRSILELLMSLRGAQGLALLVITHDLSVAHFCSTQVLRLCQGGGHGWETRS